MQTKTQYIFKVNVLYTNVCVDISCLPISSVLQCLRTVTKVGVVCDRPARRESLLADIEN